MEDCSTVISRDPSFLSGSVASLELWKKPIIAAPKNLCNSLWNLSHSEQYKVFLRIKPSTLENNTSTVLDNNTLLTKVPKESVTYKVLTSNNSLNLQRKFSFTSILDEASSQNDVFRECVLPPLKSYLQGEDCLVMAFGTTSAGKTYTMQGTSHNPGIIPRALSYIFRNLEGHLEQDGTLQPFRGTQLTRLSTTDMLKDQTFKNQILYLDLNKYQKTIDSSYMSFKSSYSRDEEEFESEDFKEMEIRIGDEEEPILGDTNDRFSVWLSMVEIYNDNIIDLLQFPNEKGDRPSLFLGEDDRGGFFVKNSQQIHVRNGHEAYQISQFGRTNLHRAPTALNDKSSRSHCVLTVTLVRHHQDFASCHRMSFVDLAGSERAKKTLNDGKRLVESKSINKSLSVLGKCLQALKANQSGRPNRIVPVRDSKMTKLFKNALMGVEKLTFIINISTDPLIFDETLHVLKFSALAQEIIPEPRACKIPTRFSQIFHSNRFREPSYTWSAASSVTDLTEKSEDVDRLKKQLEDSKNRALQLELKNQSYKSEIEELEIQLKDMEKHVEGLQELILKNEGDFKTIRLNLNDHLRKVVEKMNKTKESDMSNLRQKMNKEKEDLANYLQQQIKDLKQKNKNLNAKLKVMVHPDETSDAAYQNLVDEISKLRLDKQNMSKLLDEASQDYGEALLENEQLKKEKFELVAANEAEIDKAVEMKEIYEAEIEELTTKLNELASLQNETDLFNSEDKLLLENLKTINYELGIEIQRKNTEISEFEEQIQELLTELQDSRHLHTDFRKLKEAQAVLVSNLAHEKSVNASLENEAEILRAAVKSSCSKEAILLEEIQALKAVIVALEQEATMKVQKQTDVLSEEKLALEKCYTDSQEEIMLLKNEYSAKESVHLNKLKKLEADLGTAMEKLEEAEHQKNNFELIQQKCEKQEQVIPELKDAIERLELELIKKEQELVNSENSRKLLVSEHEQEIEKYREGSLKKDIGAGDGFMSEDFKPIAKKDEVTHLQDQFKNLKLSLRGDCSERSPLRNRTNIIVPIGDLVEISPYNKYSGSHDDSLPLSRLFSSLTNLTENSRNTPTKEKLNVPISPQTKGKSSRKPRTVKKRDPSDHPALTRSTRSGRRRSSVSPPSVSNGPKKKLFSRDSFVDLSDQDDYFAMPPNPQQKRALRSRTKKN